MTEAIAALSLAATIIQIVDYGTKVITRLKEFHSSISEAPRAFRDLLVQLPLILNTLERTRLQAQSEAIDKLTQDALLPAVQGCYIQIIELYNILSKIVPQKTDNSLVKSKKALQSVGYEKTIKQINSTLGVYIQTLTYHQATGQRSFQSLSPPHAPGPPQQPFFGVPFDRDRHFIGRVEILRRVEDAIAYDHKVALAGIGGVGKSQIAIEAAYRYRETKHGHVFWVHASTRQRFDQGYKDIAKRFLPAFDAKDDDSYVLQSVHDWLIEHGPWLLILDNADDLELFFSEKEPILPLVHYLPHSQNGCLFVTSRDRRVGERLVGRENCITVHPPDQDEAEELLQSKIPPEIWNPSTAGKLVEAVERLPLAITQAAAFISENNLTLDEYLDAFGADDSELVALLSEDSGDIRRDIQNGNSVMRTWKLSFDQIYRQKPRAAEILSLMAVLDRQGVPKRLLMEEEDSKTEFMAAMGTLQAFSLISLTKTDRKSTYEMHRLVQLAMLLWLKSQRKLTEFQCKALLRLDDQFPIYSFELLGLCECLYPHARVVTEYQFDAVETRLVHANLSTQMATYETSRYNLEMAYNRLYSAWRHREELLGQNDILTLKTQFHIADTLRLQHSPEAEAIYRDLLPKFEELTGPGSNDSLATKIDLALTLKSNQEAEILLRQVIEDAKRAGETKNYAIALDNLGVCLLSQGKREESIKFHQMALEEKKHILGPDHKSTLISMMNLSIATDPSNREEKWTREIWAKQERILGPEHPDTLLTLINLARALMRNGKYDEAEPLALQALAGKEKVLGPYHPLTLTAMDTVACLYSFKVQNETAKRYFEKALLAFDKVLGQKDPRTQGCWLGYLALPDEFISLARDPSKSFANDHPVSIVKLKQEASRIYDKGDYRQAEELQGRALALFEEISGADSLWTLSCAEDFGLTLIETWKFEEAEVLFRRVLAGRIKHLTPDHRDTLRSMNQLAVVLWNCKEIYEAEQLLLEVLAIRERLGIPENVGSLSIRNNLGLFEFERGDNAAAVQTYRALLIDRERIQGKDHTDTSLCMLSISMGLAYLREYEESRELNEKALKGLTMSLGPEHPSTLLCQSQLAKILSMLGKLDEAESTIRTTIALREKVLGPSHGNTLKSHARLGEILEKQGRFDEALAEEEHVYAVAVQSFGEDHRETYGHKRILDDLKRRMGIGEEDIEGNSEADSNAIGNEAASQDGSPSITL